MLINSFAGRSQTGNLNKPDSGCGVGGGDKSAGVWLAGQVDTAGLAVQTRSQSRGGPGGSLEGWQRVVEKTSRVKNVSGKCIVIAIITLVFLILGKVVTGCFNAEIGVIARCPFSQ